MGTRSLFLIRRFKRYVQDWMGHNLSGMTSMGTKTDEAVSMEERYRAAMVLAGAGDALGYKNGEWEFCHSGTFILEELEKLGGLKNVTVKKREWPVSDDTVMHLATAEALADTPRDHDREKMFSLIAKYYKLCMNDMSGRAPGATCMMMTHKLNPKVKGGYKIPFNPRGGGCGASMRAMCIGLRYPRPEDLKDLVAVSIESGRMTHHHPTGYLGALASALFTAYAIQGKNPIEWATGLLDVVNKEAKEYIIDSNHCTGENLNEFPYFISAWESYIELRELKKGAVKFPANYSDPRVRDKYYKKISFGGWGGASGHDSTIIAYDAILGAGQNWEELCKRGMFHGGDSDSTGTIAACCYGAMYGFTGVPENNYKDLEYRKRLEGLAKELYELAEPDDLKANQCGAHTSKETATDKTCSDGLQSSPDTLSKNVDPSQTSQDTEPPEKEEVPNDSSCGGNSESTNGQPGRNTPPNSPHEKDAEMMDDEEKNDNIKSTNDEKGLQAMDTNEEEQQGVVESEDRKEAPPKKLDSTSEDQAPTGNEKTPDMETAV